MVEQSDSPRVFVPPPLIIAGNLMGGLAVDRRLGSLPTSMGEWEWSGLVVALLGLVLVTASLGLFRRARTRPEPWQPASALIRTGLYERTRNPMYLGMLIVYLGFAIGLRSPTAALLFVPLFLIMDRIVVAREEAYLLRRFGSEFARYCSDVRRWI